MSEIPSSDPNDDAARLRTLSSRVPSYPHIMPLLVAEIMRLRQRVRELSAEPAPPPDEPS